ncbi:MAG: hypothetical protein ACTSU4_08100 [Promethearchaeota archaeon]
MLTSIKTIKYVSNYLSHQRYHHPEITIEDLKAKKIKNTWHNNGFLFPFFLIILYSKSSDGNIISFSTPLLHFL